MFVTIYGRKVLIRFSLMLIWSVLVLSSWKRGINPSPNDRLLLPTLLIHYHFLICGRFHGLKYCSVVSGIGCQDSVVWCVLYIIMIIFAEILILDSSAVHIRHHKVLLHRLNDLNPLLKSLRCFLQVLWAFLIQTQFLVAASDIIEQIHFLGWIYIDLLQLF